MGKIISTGVPLSAFIFSILTTLVVSWMPQIRAYLKERGERKEKNEARRRSVLVMKLELIDEYYSMKINKSIDDFNEKDGLTTVLDSLEEAIELIRVQQVKAKELDFEYYKKLFDLKKELYLLYFELRKGTERDDSGKVISYDEKLIKGWQQAYYNILSVFNDIEYELLNEIDPIRRH